jgi:hypothetical protein
MTQAAPSATDPNRVLNARAESVTRSRLIRRASPVRPENWEVARPPLEQGRQHSRVDEPSATGQPRHLPGHTADNNVMNNGPELIETVAAEAERLYAHADERMSV